MHIGGKAKSNSVGSPMLALDIGDREVEGSTTREAYTFTGTTKLLDQEELSCGYNIGKVFVIISVPGTRSCTPDVQYLVLSISRHDGPVNTNYQAYLDPSYR